MSIVRKRCFCEQRSRVARCASHSQNVQCIPVDKKKPLAPPNAHRTIKFFALLSFYSRNVFRHSLFAALLLGLERKVRVHPATSQCQENTKPLTRAQDLALAVPPDAENENRLQVADNVESQCARTADNQELRKVVHGGHDAGCACAPEDFRRNFADARNSVEEWDKRNKKADGNGRLVEQELWWRDSKVFNLLADPDLVQGGGAESEGGDNNTKELRLGGLVDGEADSDAGCDDGSKHVSGDLFAEHDEVDQDDGRGGHDL
jgi:hypothetical protein